MSKLSRLGSRIREHVPRFRRGVSLASRKPALALAEEILGTESTNVLDVGARSAGMERAWWRLDGLAGHFGFEPDPEECARLNAATHSGTARETYFPVALGDTHGERALYVTKNPACSSLYSPDPTVISRYPDLRAAERVGEMKVNVIPLNSWWADNGCPDVSFIKLDTQGSELDILRGGVDVLKGCVGCEVEVEFSAIYKDQALFHEVDPFMRAQGFVLWRLYGLCHYTEGPGGPWSRVENVSYGGENRTFSAGSGRLYWGNAIYFRDWQTPFYDANPKKLLILLALLEACGDVDGVASVRKRLITEKVLSADQASRI